jgi:hypothetical protein
MALTIISGVMLPRSAMLPPEFTKSGTTRPFVIVRVAGHPRDEKQRFRTAAATCGSSSITNFGLVERVMLGLYMGVARRFISDVVTRHDDIN